MAGTEEKTDDAEGGDDDNDDESVLILDADFLRQQHVFHQTTNGSGWRANVVSATTKKSKKAIALLVLGGSVFHVKCIDGGAKGRVDEDTFKCSGRICSRLISKRGRARNLFEGLQPVTF